MHSQLPSSPEKSILKHSDPEVLIKKQQAARNGDTPNQAKDGTGRRSRDVHFPPAAGEDLEENGMRSPSFPC